MRVAFAGKGGVGKTTLASLFITALSNDGVKVLAVDCDPVANLGASLGIKDSKGIVPIVEMKQLINERMEVGPGRSFYKLNPLVDDIPDKFAKIKDNIKLIVMGTVNAGGSGCMCPESSFLKALLSKILLNESESIVLDMEAGIEHLGRATASFVDNIFIVAEPSLSSLDAAIRISRLAADINVKNISVILNKVKNQDEVEQVKKYISPLLLIGSVPFDEQISAHQMTRDLDIQKTNSYLAMAQISKNLKKKESK